MQSFIRHHADKITGVLSGFDRLRLRGTLRYLANASGMASYLWNMGILLKDFKDHVESVTRRVREAVQTSAVAAGLGIHYVASPSQNKEQLARRLVAAGSAGSVPRDWRTGPCLRRPKHTRRRERYQPVPARVCQRMLFGPYGPCDANR